MDVFEKWNALDRKIIAILRGIEPREVADVVAGLIETGFQAIEVPLNSPDAYQSIELAVRTASKSADRSCLIGAGTVLAADEVRMVSEAGGNLVVSPNVSPEIIRATISAQMLSAPGVFTASEAHLAVSNGAHVLKFFPASVLGPGGVRAIQTILPPASQVCAVGGVGPGNFAEYVAAGISCFGIGSELYKPSLSAADVIERGRVVINAFDSAVTGTIDL